MGFHVSMAETVVNGYSTSQLATDGPVSRDMAGSHGASEPIVTCYPLTRKRKRKREPRLIFDSIRLLPFFPGTMKFVPSLADELRYRDGVCYSATYVCCRCSFRPFGNSN